MIFGNFDRLADGGKPARGAAAARAGVLLVLALICSGPGPAAADVQTQEVAYAADGVTMQGYLAWDDRFQGRRPGVLVVHEWWGHNDYPRSRARLLAELGYTALAVDMYGDGKTAAHPDDAQKFMTEVLANLPGARARFDAAYEVLVNHATVNASQIAAIGYCVGGGVVLHMMLHGADLDAVASFHGSLPDDVVPESGATRPSGRIAVYTGEDDPMVPPDLVSSFSGQMDALGADFQVISYPGVSHSFTNPEATAMGEEYHMPLAYNALADQSSWSHLQLLLQSVFSAAK